MYGNYTLYAYNSKMDCLQDWSFENVIIKSENNTIFVINKSGKIIYAISTNNCTVIVMEDDMEES